MVRDNGPSSRVRSLQVNDCDYRLDQDTCSWEETLYYPMFSPKFDTSQIIAEHKTFHDGAAAFEEYLVSTLPAGAKYGFDKVAPAHERVEYDGAKVRSLIDAFAAPLAAHVGFDTLNSPQILTD